MHTTSKTVIWMTILIVLFSFTFPANGFADWRDKSDELPGFMDTKDILLITAGAVLLVAVILISTGSDDDDDNASDVNTATPDTSASSGFFSQDKFIAASSQIVFSKVDRDITVTPVLGLKQSYDLSRSGGSRALDTVVLGFTVSF